MRIWTSVRLGKFKTQGKRRYAVDVGHNGDMHVFEKEKPLKVGELLVKAGFLQPGDVVEAIQVSKRVQIPIGRVLIASGLVSEGFLQTVLQAQLLIRDGLVSSEQAIDAMNLVANLNIPLKEALQKLNLTPEYNSDTVNLAEILLDSNIVTQEQLEAALATSSRAGVPLSAALVLQGVLSQSFFPSLVRAQQQLVAQSPRERIIEELKSSFLVWLKAEESLRSEFALDGGSIIQKLDKQIASEEKTESNGDKEGKTVSRRDTNQPSVSPEDSATYLVELLKASGINAPLSTNVPVAQQASAPGFEWKTNTVKPAMTERALNQLEKDGFQVQSVIPLNDGSETKILIIAKKEVYAILTNATSAGSDAK